MMKQGDSPNNQKLNTCLFAVNFTVNWNLDFGLTQKHALLQRYFIICIERTEFPLIRDFFLKTASKRLTAFSVKAPEI